MNKLRVGFATVNINPPLGIGIDGYYVPRFAKGVLDDLEVEALVLTMEEKRIALLCIDVLGVDDPIVERYAEMIEAKTGIPKDNVF